MRVFSVYDKIITGEYELTILLSHAVLVLSSLVGFPIETALLAAIGKCCSVHMIEC